MISMSAEKPLTEKADSWRRSFVQTFMKRRVEATKDMLENKFGPEVITTSSAGGFKEPLRGTFVVPPKGGVQPIHRYLSAS